MLKKDLYKPKSKKMKLYNNFRIAKKQVSRGLFRTVQGVSEKQI